MKVTTPTSPPANEAVRTSPLRKRTLLVLLAGGVVAIVLTSDALHGLLIRALDATEPVITAHPVWGATLFVLLAAASAMLAFFSSAVLVPAAVYVWGVPASAALLWLGWIVGGLVAYTVGQRLGRRIVIALTSGQVLAYADRVSARASFGFVVLFQLALPTEIPGYVLGMVCYSRSKYLLALALAELPYAVGTVYLGSSLVAQRTIALVVVGTALVVFSASTLRLLQTRLARTQDGR